MSVKTDSFPRQESLDHYFLPPRTDTPIAQLEENCSFNMSKYITQMLLFSLTISAYALSWKCNSSCSLFNQSNDKLSSIISGVGLGCGIICIGKYMRSLIHFQNRDPVPGDKYCEPFLLFSSAFLTLANAVHLFYLEKMC